MSKWRSKQLNIAPGVTDLFFDKSPKYPNIIYVSNRSPDTIYMGIGMVPTPVRFDKAIMGNDSEITGRPFEINSVTFFNPSDNIVDIMVYSDYDDNFDFSILKSKVDCYITGVKEGTEFDVMHKALDKLGGCVNNDKQIQSRPFYSSDVIAGRVTEEIDLNVNFSEINFVSNDGVDNLIVTINNGSFMLRPNECISNFCVNGFRFALQCEDGKTIDASYLMRGL